MRTILALALLATLAAPAAAQQEELIERYGPKPHEDFETDANHDGIPDGWYNPRDVRLAEGGIDGKTCLRFENDRPGRPSRLSLAFGVDGKQTEAVILGLWIRGSGLRAGERMGDEPGLAIDFLGPELRTAGRGTLGPWTKVAGPEWVHVAKRIPVPPTTLDAIMSLGLLGATGRLEVDGLTIDLVPAGGKPTTNLIRNGDFELGDPDPPSWILEHGARRAFPADRRGAVLELTRSNQRALNGLATPVDRFQALEIALMARGVGLRGAGGASMHVFFLDGDGALLPGASRLPPVFRWSGAFGWRASRATVDVPSGAVQAVVQIEKLDGSGSLLVDDVKVFASPNAESGSWKPYHVQTDTSGWRPVAPSPEVVAGSALDASFLLSPPAGRRGFVTVKDGQLHFEKGGRARFFGAALLYPTAFQEPERADALADRLARSGINLVRLGDLDAALGPSRSLIDDTREDTRELDPVALKRLDHLIAALKERGIYVALELQSLRKFREGDEVPSGADLPPGGGPASAFDPTIRKLALDLAEKLLTHVNPETGLALRDDPVLAWVTLAGEVSLFDLADPAHALPAGPRDELKALAAKSTHGTGRRFWQATETAHWTALAEGLRKMKLRVPIAGVSHYRREPTEFDEVQWAPGLDLVDDRLFWTPSKWGQAERRSILRSVSGGLLPASLRKRNPDRPYVVGQWCDQSEGAWALPYEAADAMLAAVSARQGDWDALVRRGIFIFPEVWGSSAVGTAGGEDFFKLPEVVNGIPQVFALWPHAASVVLRGHTTEKGQEPGRAGSSLKSVVGLDTRRGRLVIDTPFTQGLAGWSEDRPQTFPTLSVGIDHPFGVVVASSLTSDPIAASRRLLVSAVARVEPTGFHWVDEWKHEVADPGQPPLLQEPIRASVAWKRKGDVKAYMLDNTGARVGPVKLGKTADGVVLEIDGSSPTFHWELVAE